MKKQILLLVILFSATAGHSQFVSRLGRFQVDQVRGCAPFTITITDTNLITVGECTPGKPCLMDFLGNNTQQQNQFTFTYNTPGTFKLSVFYQSILDDDIMVTVDPNIQPAFEIYSRTNSRVSIKVTDRNYDQYLINFGDGSPVVQIPSSNNQVAQHSYVGPGNFPISVKGKKNNAADNCNSLSKPFQAIAILPTTQISSLTAIDASTLRLDFTPQPNVQYKLEIAINSTNFQQFQTLYGVNTITIPSLRLDDNYYCFRLSSVDPESGQSINFSEPVCSHNFDLTLVSGGNRLNWQTPSTGVTKVDILRDKNLYRVISGAPVTFADVDVKCNITYCYQVRSAFVGGATSTSLEKCEVSFTTEKPSAVLNTNVMVLDGGVQLDWIQDPAFKASTYTVLRAANQGTYVPISTVVTPTFVDNTYATSDGFCYQINYVDECKNKSDNTVSVCPIRLQGTINNRNEVTLTWSDYSGWNLGVQSYSLEKYDKAGVLIRTVNLGTATTFLDDQPDTKNQIVSYRVVARANQAVVGTSTSNQLTFTKSINLVYPTAFTPDEKGPTENEVFELRGQFIARLELSIFDRWGALVFYSDKNEPWDGTQLGLPMPLASYVWTATITDLAGRSFKRTGTVVLLRK
ncbi:MAG: gliding motility-associated C-terminal domain-containing protein [Cyclobacteriaceae bacterium]|nr:gliding motility-associated C-terminal domain-containing protein [Cyclobacteriaceae bacterium]